MWSNCGENAKKVWRKWICNFFQKFSCKYGMERGMRELKVLAREFIVVIDYYIYSGKERTRDSRELKKKT